MLLMIFIKTEEEECHKQVNKTILDSKTLYRVSDTLHRGSDTLYTTTEPHKFVQV